MVNPVELQAQGVKMAFGVLRDQIRKAQALADQSKAKLAELKMLVEEQQEIIRRAEELEEMDRLAVERAKWLAEDKQFEETLKTFANLHLNTVEDVKKLNGMVIEVEGQEMIVYVRPRKSY